MAGEKQPSKLNDQNQQLYENTILWNALIGLGDTNLYMEMWGSS